MGKHLAFRSGFIAAFTSWTGCLSFAGAWTKASVGGTVLICRMSSEVIFSAKGFRAYSTSIQF